MRLVVEIIEGPGQGRRKGVRPPCKLVIGRSLDADISVADDPLMSANHFQLDCQPERCMLHDLHSTNGTSVNDQPVSAPVVLQDGDTVLAGRCRFRVSISQPVLPTTEGASGGASGTTAQRPPAKAAPRDVHRAVEPPGPKVRSADAPRAAPTAPPAQAGSAVSMVCLQTADGPDEGRRAWLRTGQSMRVGRSEQADFVVHGDPSIADIHLALRFDGQTCRLSNVGAGCRTLLNGTPVNEASLFVGDQLQIGRTNLRVTVGPACTTPPHAGAAADAASTAFALHDLVEKRVPKGLAWPFALGLSDPEPSVRIEAMRAAAWSRQPWLLAYCADACVHPALAQAMDVVHLLAVLAGGDRLPAIRGLLKREDLGAARYRLAGIYGHPALLDELVAVLESSDAESSAAAGWALQRITGADLPTIEDLAAQGGDQESASPPIDPQAARRYVRSAQQRFAAGDRFCRGVNLTAGQPWQPQPLDLASRAEAILREHYHGRRAASRQEKRAYFSTTPATNPGGAGG